MVGAVLSSRYRLLRLLGEGGLGAVFEAEDLAGGGRCAVKVLRPEYAAERRVVTQFYAGAEMSARLSHANIARCLGHGPSDESSPYVVNELLRFAMSQDAEFHAYKDSVNSSGGGKVQGTAASGRPRTATADETETTPRKSDSSARQ